MSKKNKVKKEGPKEGWVKAQRVGKDSKGNEIVLDTWIPEHLADDPKKGKMLKRNGIILHGETAFISKEQVEQEKEEYRVWANSIDKISILEGLLPMEKVPYKIDILNDRIKELSAVKPNPKKEVKAEPVTPKKEEV
jgi:hypothetical protein